jgi:hypothetical protein
MLNMLRRRPWSGSFGCIVFGKGEGNGLYRVGSSRLYYAGGYSTLDVKEY